MTESNTLEGVNALLFDFGGTLEYPGLHLNQRLERALRKRVGDFDTDSMNAASLSTIRGLYDHPDSPKMSYPEILVTFVAATLGGMGYDHLAKEIAQEMITDSAEEMARNKPVLESIRQHYRIAVLSNNYGNTEGFLRDYEVAHLFEKIYDSTLIGLRKPGKEIFQYALDGLGWKAEETAYVGDRWERDVHGPKSLGMKTIMVMGDIEKPGTEPTLLDARIRSLYELPKILTRMK